MRLTPTEWQLLEILVRHSGRLVSQRQLLAEVWGPQYETEGNYLRVYMAHLRRKLEPDPARPRYLLTEPGMGYRFTATATAPAAGADAGAGAGAAVRRESSPALGAQSLPGEDCSS